MNSKNNGVYDKSFKENKKETTGKSKSHIIHGKGYALVFLLQTVICILIIAAVAIVKYTSPESFVPVSAVLDGLYGKNVSLEDLSVLLEERISDDDTLSVFFNTIVPKGK